MPSPLLWGNEDAVRERFAGTVADIQSSREQMRFDFPFGPKETVERFRKYCGPTQKAFDAVDDAGQVALRADLEELWADANIATDGMTVVYSEYLSVTAARK